MLVWFDVGVGVAVWHPTYTVICRGPGITSLASMIAYARVEHMFLVLCCLGTHLAPGYRFCMAGAGLVARSLHRKAVSPECLHMLSREHVRTVPELLE